MAYIVKKRGIYYVRWRERGRGSPVRAIRAGPKKTDALRVKVEVEARLLAGRVGSGVVPRRIAFHEWAEKWLAMRTTRPKTQDRDRRIVRVHLLPAFGSMLLSSITTEDIAALVARIAHEVSPWTARRVFAVLRKIVADAKRAGYLRDNPAADVSQPPMPHIERRLPSVEQVGDLLRALPAGRDRALALTLALVGCRWGEAGALEWTDLSDDVVRVHIRRSLPANTKEVGAPKSASGRRSIGVPWPVRQALMDLPQRSTVVFPGIGGGYLSHRWWSRAVWRPAVRAVGLRLRIQDLRHLSASWRLAWGDPVPDVARELGHSSPAFTYRQYAHVLEEGQTLEREAVLAKLCEAYRAGCGTKARASASTGHEPRRKAAVLSAFLRRGGR